MDWFSGGVATAIASCRQENAIFIVYIYDDSAGSKATDEAWSNKEVSELMSSRKYVALKVAKDSLEYNQFSQLYAVFLVPSVFCIGRTGQVLMPMNGAQTASQLKEKLRDAFHKYDAEAQSSSTSSSEPLAATATPQPTQLVSSATPTISDAASGNDSNPDDSKEETLKRYQDKIKERRQERAKDEFEKDKHHEIQRREHGKNVAKFKQEREEQQTQNWLKERQKQKEEARLAREAVRAKLEQDKLERQSRQRDAAAVYQQQVQDASRPVSSTVTSSATVSVCRIQLKLPAGNTKVVEMNKTDNLEALRLCVAKEINERVENILLSSSYPRKELGTDSDSLTMLQLQLVPSGVVIVRVKKSSYPLSSGSSSGAGIFGVLMSLVHLLLYCINLIKNAFVGIFSGGRSQEPTPDEPQPASRYQEKNIKGVQDKDNSDGLRVRKFRQEDYHDDSDEDGTYNGNSTQQQ